MESSFLTGSTGLLGAPILKALITQTELKDFYLLVRDKENAKEKLAEAIIEARNLGKNIYFLEGDVTKENLGLQEEISLLNEIDEVYHLAAITSLSKDNGETIFETNTKGTKNLLESFKNSKNLKNFFYFSTAYSCGRENKKINEAWLEKPVDFRNPYEESKWLAERIIKFYLENYNLPITIFRPSVIASEDKSLFSQLSRQTIYLHGSIIRRASLMQKDDKKIRLVGKPNTFINLITIEDIVKIILKIRLLQFKAKIYNLTNTKNCLAMPFLEGLRETLVFNSGYIFSNELKFEDLTEAEKYIYKRTEPYFPYNLDSDLNWDSSNTEEIRKDLNLKPKDEAWLNRHAKEFFLNIKYERQ